LIYTKTIIPKFSIKQIITSVLGGSILTKKLNAEQIPTNSTFCGFYNFDPKKNYRELFKRFLKASKNNGLIMCHPALSETKDEIGVARKKEYEYLSSKELLLDCTTLKINIQRFKKNNE
jgi:hypothetical protein